MALIECPMCKKMISPEADKCINCGHPMQTALRCPNCRSTDIIKISFSDKVTSAVLFGIFALGKISKSFKCKNCDFSW